MRHVPEAVALYEQLGVKKAPLSLIPPAFETPLPALRPATFPPVLREPPPPALELFDLDEAFAGEQVSPTCGTCVFAQESSSRCCGNSSHTDTLPAAQHMPLLLQAVRAAAARLLA
jgi:hypothetical protein